MTIQDAINKINERKPGNTHSDEWKIMWLSNLDGLIKAEIIDTHVQLEPVEFVPYTPATPYDTVLLVPAPYDMIYIYWLEAQMCYADNEIDSFNTAASMYSNMLGSFRQNYNMNHQPASTGGLRFRF